MAEPTVPFEVETPDLLLEKILGLGALRPRYQPIYDISGPVPRIRGAEVLTRGPKGTNLESADLLFAYARYMKAEDSVDRSAVSAGLMAIEGVSDVSLHVNVNASTLARDADYASFLSELCAHCRLDNSRLVVEIVEQTEILDRSAFLKSLEDLRRQGFRIALDDVGLGRSNFLMFYLTRPDFLKVDRFFVDGISTDPVRRAVLTAVGELAKSLDCRVVAEGVEREEDLVALREQGIGEVQGYLFSRPLEAGAFQALVSAQGGASGETTLKPVCYGSE